MIRRICRVRSGEESRQLLLPYLRDFPEAVVLATTKAAADELVWSAGGGTMGLHRRTLNQLAVEMAAGPMAAGGLVPLSPLAGEAIAARAIHEAKGKLTYFSPVADTPGFVQAAARTIRELRVALVSPAKLSRRGPAARDLSLLLRRWTALCEKFQLADEAHVLALAAMADDQPFGGLPLLVLDAPLLSQAAAAFFGHLLKRSPAVVVTVMAGDRETDAAWRSLLGIPSEEPPVANGGQLNGLRAQLFSARPESLADDESVQFFSSPGENMECVEIARRIHNAARSGGKFDEIAVLLRQPDRYQPLLEDALRRADIPAYFSRGVRRPDPAGRAFLTLLSCAAENLSASRFAEYLSLAQVPDLSDDGAPVPAASPVDLPVDEFAAGLVGQQPPPQESAAPVRTPPAPSSWEKLLVDAAVIGGADRWRRRLAGAAAELQLQLQAIAEDDGHREHLQQRLNQLASLQRFALPVVQALDELPRRATWDGWLAALASLARLTLRYPSGVLSLLAEMQPLDGVGPVSVTEVRDVLSSRLSTLRVEPLGRRFGAVFVGSIEEARGRHFEIAFVPGLAEGLFPKKILEDPLLLDSVRHAVDPALTVRQALTDRERLLLEIAAGASARVVFSYPAMDTALGRGRVPSLYALEVERAAKGVLSSLEEFERRWRMGASARLGWPAPEDAKEAIDNTEYDLAVRGSLHPGDTPEQVRGRMAYLLDNPHAARSLRARYRRWDTKHAWTTNDGLWAPQPETLATLQRRGLTQAAYSPTSLQAWAACPYRFYLHSILRLKERGEAAAIEQMDPATRGEIFHAVQFRILTTLRDEGALPVTRSSLDAAQSVADRALDEAAAEYRELLCPAIPPVWGSEIESMRTDLRGWLRDVALEDGRWTPAHFELRFGLAPNDSCDPASTQDEVVVQGGYRLRGSIDLVERNREDETLRVVDHKTGRVLDDRESPLLATGRGEVLQPVLYSLAAERLLNAAVRSGDLFYCTQTGGYDHRAVSISDLARDRAYQVLEAVDRSVREGSLPAAPRKDACLFCDYRTVCGPYEERRTADKPMHELAGLAKVRGQR